MGYNDANVVDIHRKTFFKKEILGSRGNSLAKSDREAYLIWISAVGTGMKMVPQILLTGPGVRLENTHTYTQTRKEDTIQTFDGCRHIIISDI